MIISSSNVPAIEKPRRLDGARYLTLSTELVPRVHFSNGWYNGISFRTRNQNGTLLFMVAEDGETIHIQVKNENINIPGIKKGV